LNIWSSDDAHAFIDNDGSLCLPNLVPRCSGVGKKMNGPVYFIYSFSC